MNVPVNEATTMNIGAVLEVGGAKDRPMVLMVSLSDDGEGLSAMRVSPSKAKEIAAEIIGAANAAETGEYEGFITAPGVSRA